MGCGAEKGDHTTELEQHKRLLVLWNASISDNLPACVRHAQELQGCLAGCSCAPMPSASPEQQRSIKAAIDDLLVTA